MFFRPTPGVGHQEKARLEYHAQQIAESIGFERLKLPVLDPETAFSTQGVAHSIREIQKSIGQFLGHDTAQIIIQQTFEPLKKCGGGG